jgi:alkylhydroperoxidase/carboxymuconolactone decarboxylase family protein YurZ
MENQPSLISKAFQTFMTDAPQHAQAWGKVVQELSQASALDAKTRGLAYLAVMAPCASRVAYRFTCAP